MSDEHPAGLGRDAFVLADLGCTVTLWERSPVLGLLLDFAIARARDHADPRVRDAAQRMTLHSGDVRGAPGTESWDVIYLDPMFVEARKALPGKEMQVLHHLLGDAADYMRLLMMVLRMMMMMMCALLSTCAFF